MISVVLPALLLPFRSLQTPPPLPPFTKNLLGAGFAGGWHLAPQNPPARPPAAPSSMHAQRLCRWVLPPQTLNPLKPFPPRTPPLKWRRGLRNGEMDCCSSKAKELQQRVVAT